MQHMIHQLDDFDPARRREALKALYAQKPSFPIPDELHNLHYHSFFSFNAENWSPSRIAWEARTNGLFAAGIIDFDELAGQEEFLEASLMLELRATVGIETRAYLSEFADKEIDSPGEPGVSYIAGTGFTRPIAPGTPQYAQLQSYRQTARARNESLIGRINPHTGAVSIDYQRDVLPLAPSGNATERHIVTAYVNRSQQVFADKPSLNAFWSDILGKSLHEIESLLANRPAFEEAVRNKLAKRGGFGYEQPTSATFPPVEEFFTFVKSCGAIPMESWLDGTSAGESDPEALLELSMSKGAAALNLIPDRNWNIKDPAVKSVKTANLRKVIETADRMGLPLHIGTEMNKKGLPFVDDINTPDLQPYKHEFIRGAAVCIGHAVLVRYADFSYCEKKAENMFATRASRNGFFASVGLLPPVNESIARRLEDAGYEKAFELISESAKKQKWII